MPSEDEEEGRPTAEEEERRHFGQEDDASIPDLDNAHHLLNDDDSIIPLPQPGGEQELFIWGTEINANLCKQTFRQFLKYFRVHEYDDEPCYFELLQGIQSTQDYSLTIDCQHLLMSFSKHPNLPNLCDLCVKHPRIMIPLMDLVVHEEFCEMFPESEQDLIDTRIQIRLWNLPHTMRMRELDPKHIDQLVQIKGMVIRNSAVVPDLKQGYFVCQQCKFSIDSAVDRGHIVEPKRCPHCTQTNQFRLVHNRCFFADKQSVKVQENTETVREGETPHTCTVYLYDNLVDCVKPGDRVNLCGILCAKDVRVDPKKRTVKSVYSTHLDVLHVSWIAGREDEEEAALAATGTSAAENEVITFELMAEEETLYEDLAASLAPSIFQLVDVKKGLLLQMLGGSNQSVSADQDQGNNVRAKTTSRTRGEINILLCGDPGTSKSQLLGYVHRVAPRGIYTSGKGSSAVGLTAYITKDPETREFVLESGALVLSDRGVCCIDEFDKMNDSVRAILLEVMEQQTISLAKSGIICSLNARTSILASANPVGSRYDPKISVVENLKLPPTLLSRFDLIYLVLDRADMDQDRQLAKHLVRLFTKGSSSATATAVPAKYTLKQVSKYIKFARERSKPAITDEVKDRLIESYVEMRKRGNMGGGGKKTIVATPRQLESFVRLAEARAKVRLAKYVSVADVDEAVRLFNVATQRAAMDPRTGTIDMDAIVTGVSTLDRMKEQSLVQFLKAYLQENHAAGQVIKERQLLDKLNERGEGVEKIERTDLVRALQELERDRMLLLSKHGIRLL
ncbi:hypothetical protein BASA81_005424 [Batrachochytrium salamandrivorans]|nr:hypothetical protein BASA81_005424 [Batrachochytrium salamandrivorans]